MGRYDPLPQFLHEKVGQDSTAITFSEIENVVGPLPKTARTRPSWWLRDSGPQAKVWLSAGYQVKSVDLVSQIAVFTTENAALPPPAAHSTNSDAPGSQSPSTNRSHAPQSSDAQSLSTTSRGYLSRLNLPLVGTLFLLIFAIGGVGYGLRPGTDSPPSVPSPRLQIYVTPENGQASQLTSSTVLVEETLFDKDASTVQLQVDIFAKQAPAGRITWQLLTDVSDSSPRLCASPYKYVGKNQENPYRITNGTLKLGGQPITDASIADFTGRPMSGAAANTLALAGRSPAAQTGPDPLAVAQIDLCWIDQRPIATDGEYTSVALPATGVDSFTGGALNSEITRNLYFISPLARATPITAQYSLQAGSLPTSTDSFGWHWANSGEGLIQLTALSISESQHEALLGFLSGALLGVAGSALISLIQVLLEAAKQA